MPDTMTAVTVGKAKPVALYPTRHDLTPDARSVLVEMLDARLADAIDLQTQAKQAHWNVKGPTFASLHELFDKLTEDAEEYADLLAERAVQLGGIVHGTARQVAARSTVPEFPMVRDGRQHLDAMAAGLAAFGKEVRHSIGLADELGDADTADIFTEISRGVDKWLWFVEAHLHAEK